jgi:hypothetical protein
MKTFSQFREDVSQTVVTGQGGSGGIVAQPAVNLNIKNKNKIATSSNVKVNSLGDMTGGPYFGSAFN